jgi:hypothetical protein
MPSKRSSKTKTKTTQAYVSKRTDKPADRNGDSLADAKPQVGGPGVTRVAIVKAWAGCTCSAQCKNPLITVGNTPGSGLAVVVNVMVDPDGHDIDAGVVVEGAKWGRLEAYHLECYERVGRARWGPPTKDTRRIPTVVRKRIPY